MTSSHATEIGASELAQRLRARILDRKAAVGVIGLGYVGLPLVRLFNARGFSVTGLDLDRDKVEKLNAGQSYIKHFDAGVVQGMLETGRFRATTDFARLVEMDAIVICVPTPLTRQREPDISYIVATGEAIAKTLRPGQLIVLESTTYPGTTKDILIPTLEARGLRSGRDFFVAYSPEREDPGNATHATAEIPKVVGADGDEALQLALALYDQVVVRTVPVSSTAVAEAVKLTENIFRAVNIALVNELKIVFTRMGIDVWEVIEAAKSKPFGFMPFYPGPGLGGHCIPIDPFYLTWKAREFDVATRFIELAGEINTAMPHHVVATLSDALNDRFTKSLKGSRILLLGAAYKKNVDDMRESPSLKLMEMIEAKGAAVDYYDPFVPVIPAMREHAGLAGRRSIAWNPAVLGGYDAALICTDHDGVDYAALVAHVPLTVDTRNATRAVLAHRDRIVKA